MTKELNHFTLRKPIYQRLEKFRLKLINEIPRFPNNIETKEILQKRDLQSVLVDYVNWKSRFVSKRPREVKIELEAQLDKRWQSKKTEIEAFLLKVRLGIDLTPHLSERVHKKGLMIPSVALSQSPESKFLDKDFELNNKGYHHFHLGQLDPKHQFVERTNELLFAKVERDLFTVVAIFDHSVFDKGSEENSKLWNTHRRFIYQKEPHGSFYALGNVTSSGHSDNVVTYALHCNRILTSVDPQLDDPDYIRQLYSKPEEAPIKSKLEWTFNHLDLAIYDHAKPSLLIFQQGWN